MSVLSGYNFFYVSNTRYIQFKYSCLLQDDSWDEWQYHMPIARYEDNLSVFEAYNDPYLQPVVVMKKLTETQYVTVVKF